MNEIKRLADNALSLYNERRFASMQQELYQLYLNFNRRGGGYNIINYPNKNELAECFTLMLNYDWIHDNEVRQVWAEDGFYCIVKYMNETKSMLDLALGAMDMFLLLCAGKNDLRPKFQDIINKAVVFQNKVFEDMWINNSSTLLIDQFLYLSARMMQPIVKMHPEVLSPNIRKAYNSILSRKDIEKDVTPTQIEIKAKFIANVIENILEEM